MVTEKSCNLPQQRLDLLDKKEMEPVQLLQMNINQTNTYRKDLSWLYFDDEPRVQERYQVKERQSCISVFVAYRKIPSSNKQHQSGRDNSIPCMVVLYREIQSNIRTEKNIERIKSPNFLEAVLAIEIMYELQSNLEQKVNPSILKDDFSSTTDPSIFTSIAPVLLDRPNKTSWVFPALKSTNHFLS